MGDLGHSPERGLETQCVDGHEHLKLCVVFILFHFMYLFIIFLNFEDLIDFIK